MSALKRDPTVTTSPFRISNDILALTHLANRLVNLDTHFFAILLHLLPVLGDLSPGFGKLTPRHGRTSRRFLDHVNAIFHRADVVAEAAAYAVFLANLHARTGRHGLFFSIRTYIVRIGLNHFPIFRY